MAKLIRQDTGDIIEFSESIYPVDEFGWSKVTENLKYSVGGTPIIQTAVRKSGKPFTLQAPDDRGWLKRWQVELLQAWADVQNLKMWYERTVNGQVKQTKVIFNHSNNPIEAKPVTDTNSPKPKDPFNAKINLREIE